MYVDACLVGNNGRAQLLSFPLSETHVRNSKLLGNTAPAWVDRGGRFYLGTERVEGGLEEIKPDLLVLDGASLLAVPKDFKDVEADAHAGVPTLLVLLDRRA